MKRKLFLTIFSVFFLCGIFVLTLYLSFPNLFDLSSSDPAINEIPRKTFEYRVLKGEVKHTYETTGQVISGAPELYIVTFDLEKISDETFELVKEPGENFAKGDTVYTSNGKSKTVDFNGKVVDVVSSDNGKNLSVKLLNYDALFVVAEIDLETYSKITYSTPATVIYNNAEYNATIKNIGYEVVNDQVQIQLSAPDGVLPGSSVTVCLVLDTDTVGLYVPTAAIYNNGDHPYAFVRDGEGKKQVEITVGQEFSLEEDGNVFHYIEILSGVKETDILLVEEVSDYATKLEEELANG